MFSARFHWDLRPNRLSELVAQKRRLRAPLLDLTESNPTRAGLEYPAGDILESLADPGGLVYDPHPAGLPEARAAVARYYADRGHQVSADRILLTASTSEAYAYLFKLLTNPGDDVLVPRPSYPLFDFLAAMESVEVRRYPLVYHGAWGIDLSGLREALSPRTRAIVLVNPNNPTGSFVKPAELAALAALCRSRRMSLISDEVFCDYSFAPNAGCMASLAGVSEVPSFVMSGLSKIAGLPQLKLGWIVVGGPPEYRQQAFERLEWIADTYLSVATPVQRAAPRLLERGMQVQEQIQTRMRQNLAFLGALLGNNSPCRVLAVEGGWYATLQVPRIQPEEDLALELLAKDNVLVQPGYFYDFPAEAYLVLSLITQPKTFRDGIRRLLARVCR